VKKFSEIFPPDLVIRCDCGSCAFFACLRPIVVYDGVPYDASEYLKPEQIAEVLKRGQAREQLVPIKAMDP
jgi:hypothetical protein